MKTGEAEQWLQQQLQTVYKGAEKEAVAAMVMEHITNLSRGERLLIKEEELSEVQLNDVIKIAQLLNNHPPVQYILGYAWFCGIKLYVDSSVLIPRPETEELVDWIIKDVQSSGLKIFKKGTTNADNTTELKILDVGTGSGCIALALKKGLPRAEVWGCDVSEKALNVARRNGSEADIRVDFQGVDFLDDAQQKLLPTVDIIVSNPPYIPAKDKEQMAANVIINEPHTALFVPDTDALIFYRSLAQFGKKRLHEGGTIYVEINEDFGNEVVQLFSNAGYINVELKKDMQGKNRMVKAMIGAETSSAWQ